MQPPQRRVGLWPRDHIFFLALLFQKKENASPVHLLRRRLRGGERGGVLHGRRSLPAQERHLPLLRRVPRGGDHLLRPSRNEQAVLRLHAWGPAGDAGRLRDGDARRAQPDHAAKWVTCRTSSSASYTFTQCIDSCAVTGSTAFIRISTLPPSSLIG